MSDPKRQGSLLPQCEANKRLKIEQQLGQVDPRSFILCRVARKFKGELHYGTVTSYDEPNWDISYDDGDGEEYDAEDMKDHLLEEAKAAPSKSDPRLFISCRVARQFKDKLHHGTVTDYDEKDKYWKILYDDNDAEEFDEEDLKMALLAEAKSASKSDPRAYINAHVAKVFQRKEYGGTVTDYDEKAKFWTILYDDGDTEEWDEEDLKMALLEADDPRLYISCRVAKEFNGKLCHGSVTDYDEKAKCWKVLHDNNDAEEFDEEALEMAVLEEAKSARSKPDPRSYIKFRVAKVFQRKKYYGTVMDYDEEANYWQILYDDGDSDEYDETDMKKYLTLFMSGNSWKVAHSSDGGNKIGSRIIEKVRLVDKNAKKETTLLSYVLGERVLSMEIPLNADEAKKRFDPCFTINGSRYQLASRKILSDGSVPSWGSYNKPKCVNLLYAQVTGPDWAPLSVKDTLLKLGDFSALPPTKVVARLELLQSPAHIFKNKNNVPGLIFISSSEVCLMEDVGYDGDGNGSISEEKFEEMLIPLVGKELAKRILCFQGRLIIPTLGIFKGVFCRKRITNGPPIQLRSSMLKVPASTHPDRHDNAALLICKHKLHPLRNTINDYIGRKLNGSCNAGTKAFEKFTKLCEQKPLKSMIIRLWRCLGVPEKDCRQYKRQCLKPKRRNHAWIVGLADPTGSIPPGHVFVTGTQKCPATQGEIFVTRSPCTKPNDGRMLPTATSNQMPADVWEWLSSWTFGAIIFGDPKPGTMSIPEQVAGGDLDGDDYFVCWDREILSHMKAKAQPIVCNRYVARKAVVGENVTRDPNWFENAQKLLVDAEQIYAIDRLIRELWTLAKNIADESEMFLADPDAIAASLAYDQALKSSKHGTNVTLPKHLCDRLPEVVQKFVDITE